jgi:hypothetical protein
MEVRKVRFYRIIDRRVHHRVRARLKNRRRMLSGRAEGFLQNPIPLQNDIFARRIRFRRVRFLRPNIRQSAKQNCDCQKTM